MLIRTEGGCGSDGSNMSLQAYLKLCSQSGHAQHLVAQMCCYSAVPYWAVLAVGQTHSPCVNFCRSTATPSLGGGLSGPPSHQLAAWCCSYHGLWALPTHQACACRDHSARPNHRACASGALAVPSHQLCACY